MDQASVTRAASFYQKGIERVTPVLSRAFTATGKVLAVGLDLGRELTVEVLTFGVLGPFIEPVYVVGRSSLGVLRSAVSRVSGAGSRRLNNLYDVNGELTVKGTIATQQAFPESRRFVRGDGIPGEVVEILSVPHSKATVFSELGKDFKLERFFCSKG